MDLTKTILSNGTISTIIIVFVSYFIIKLFDLMIKRLFKKSVDEKEQLKAKIDFLDKNSVTDNKLEAKFKDFRTEIDILIKNYEKINNIQITNLTEKVNAMDENVKTIMEDVKNIIMSNKK